MAWLSLRPLDFDVWCLRLLSLVERVESHPWDLVSIDEVLEDGGKSVSSLVAFDIGLGVACDTTSLCRVSILVNPRCPSKVCIFLQILRAWVLAWRPLFDLWVHIPDLSVVMLFGWSFLHWWAELTKSLELSFNHGVLSIALFFPHCTRFIYLTQVILISEWVSHIEFLSHDGAFTTLQIQLWNSLLALCHSIAQLLHQESGWTLFGFLQGYFIQFLGLMDLVQKLMLCSFVEVSNSQLVQHLVPVVLKLFYLLVVFHVNHLTHHHPKRLL